MAVIEGRVGSHSVTMSEASAKEYKKTATIRATQMDKKFSVNTSEGIMVGYEGDWLAEGPAGECWPIKGEIFEATYVEV